MKGALKYIILAIIACICSIAIYYFVVPEAEASEIGITFHSNKKEI